MAELGAEQATEGVRSPRADDQATSVSALPEWVRQSLRCPVCRGPLEDGHGPQGAPELRCAGSCAAAGGRIFRIENGIPVLLVDESRTS